MSRYRLECLLPTFFETHKPEAGFPCLFLLYVLPANLGYLDYSILHHLLFFYLPVLVSFSIHIQ